MGSKIEPTKNLWQETPLIHSNRLSETTGANVYLKLENLHPSHSFKYRGISHFVQDAKTKHGPGVHLVIASGGNAGLAAACAARSLALRCTVFIPEGAAKSTIDSLKRENAEVSIRGKQYSEALEGATALVEKESNAVMVPAYDNPTVWEGHSSMIHEIKVQLRQVPDAIFCSVGGAGLLGGIIVGCKDVGWDHGRSESRYFTHENRKLIRPEVPLVALETIGSDCFYRSMALNGNRFNNESKLLPQGIDLVYNGEHSVYLAHFNSFSSKASGSLGASEPSAAVVKMALERAGGIKTASIPDELCMQTLASFADDHKLFVELACATTLVPAYHREFFEKLVDANARVRKDEKRPVVVFIVCGGFKIDLETVAEYQKLVEDDVGEIWTVRYDDGQLFSFRK